MDILRALKRELLVLPGVGEGGYDNDYHYNNNNINDDDDDEYDDDYDNDNNNIDEVDPLELAIFHDLLYKPTEKSISLRVKTLVADGDANNDELLLEILLSLSSGPKLFDQLVTEMAEDILELSHPLALRLFNAFAPGYQTSNDHHNSSTTTTKLKPIHSFASMESFDNITPRIHLSLYVLLLVKKKRLNILVRMSSYVY